MFVVSCRCVSWGRGAPWAREARHDVHEQDSGEASRTDQHRRVTTSRVAMLILFNRIGSRRFAS